MWKSWLNMFACLYGGFTQQPWVFLLKMIILGCFGDTSIVGNLHIYICIYIYTFIHGNESNLKNINPNRNYFSTWHSFRWCSTGSIGVAWSHFVFSCSAIPLQKPLNPREQLILKHPRAKYNRFRDGGPKMGEVQSHPFECLMCFCYMGTHGNRQLTASCNQGVGAEVFVVG